MVESQAAHPPSPVHPARTITKERFIRIIPWRGQGFATSEWPLLDWSVLKRTADHPSHSAVAAMTPHRAIRRIQAPQSGRASFTRITANAERRANMRFPVTPCSIL